MRKKLVNTAIMSSLMGSTMPLIIVISNFGFSIDTLSLWLPILPKSIPVAFVLGNIFGPISTKITNKFIK